MSEGNRCRSDACTHWGRGCRRETDVAVMLVPIGGRGCRRETDVAVMLVPIGEGVSEGNICRSDACTHWGRGCQRETDVAVMLVPIGGEGVGGKQMSQ